MEYRISIIIPAWHESSIINQTINTIVSLPCNGDFEVIVVDGSAAGETIRAIQNREVRTAIAETGRARQMNEGASRARGDILLFLHADTVLPRDALRSIASVMAKKDVVGGAFDLGIQSNRPIFRIIENAASLRSRITRIPYGDQAPFIRKDYFHAVGGFQEIPLMEDVELMRRIKKAGGRIRFVPEKVKTSPRRWETEGILYCTVRNWTIRALYFLGVSPENLIRFYR
ncbi:MAG: TIGR04283 family arsenosugar biosynthesis glycosyltransferase [Thermodesulfovibrionales bacterium]|jgi:rSAM/selenodomain-associated transferase 2